MTSYSDADYVGCKVDRKIISETYQFLGIALFRGLPRNKIPWPSQLSRRSILRLSLYAQVLCMKYTLLDFDLYYADIKHFVIILVLFI